MTQVTWTAETLEVFLTRIMDERDKAYQQRWEAQERAVSAALIAQEKAVTNALSAASSALTKAEAASEKRFDAINEKIGLNPRGLVGMVDGLREYKDTSSGKADGSSAAWAYVVAAASLIIGIGSLILSFNK